MIPYGKQSINQNDIDSVVDVLKSDFLTQGPAVPQFENCVAEQCQSEFALAVNSGTSALHIACLALDLGKGDWLWTTPNSFVASANCGVYCGAQIDFVDIDPQTYNLCAHELEKKLQVAKQNNQLPKVVVPVHFAGQSCDMQRIHELSLEYGFKIIEDASHAIGAKYLGSPVGNCRFSDATVFSFHPVKIVTTAEGGLVTTNSPELNQKMQLLRTHGITRDPQLMTKEPEGGWYYQQIDLGFNYRMTDMQAALGFSQMQRLEYFIEQRHLAKDRYDEALKDLPILCPFQSPDCHSALHLYPIQFELSQIGKSRQELYDSLRENGIGVNVHYIPIHTQPFYQAMGFQNGDFPRAELYYSQAVSLPMYHGLTEQDQNQVIQVLKKVLQ